MIFISINWSTASDWDNAYYQFSSNQYVDLHHNAVANTSRNNEESLARGFSWESPYKSGSLYAYWPLGLLSQAGFVDVWGDHTISNPNVDVTHPDGVLDTNATSLNSGSDNIKTPFSGINDPFSISLWFKTQSGAGRLFEAYGGTAKATFLEMQDTGELVYGRTQYGYGVTHVTPDQYDDGNWHHVLCTYAGTSGTDLVIFVDGQNEEDIYASGSDMSIPGNLRIGNLGAICDVRVYTEQLTEADAGVLSDITNGAELVTDWRSP